MMKKLTAKALSLFTSVRLQRQQAKSTIATLIFTFLLLQCTTYKKQVEADAGQGKIETEQKDVASGQTRQKTMAKKGRRVNLPLLPDSLTKDIYITDSMQALYDDEEWVIKQLHKQCNSNPEQVSFIKVDTIPPLFMEMFPGVDIYREYSKHNSEMHPWPVLEYCGYHYRITEFNLLYALVERTYQFAPEEQIKCMMQIQYFKERDFTIDSIIPTKYIDRGTTYQYVAKGAKRREFWGYYEIEPYWVYVVFKNNQIWQTLTCYNNNICGGALGFARGTPTIIDYFNFYGITDYFVK